jgi:hypothetical protein
MNYICKGLTHELIKMKRSNILVLIAIAALAYSCNIAKTCPTYAKGKNQGIESVKSR